MILLLLLSLQSKQSKDELWCHHHRVVNTLRRNSRVQLMLTTVKRLIRVFSLITLLLSSVLSLSHAHHTSPSSRPAEYDMTQHSHVLVIPQINVMHPALRLRHFASWGGCQKVRNGRESQGILGWNWQSDQLFTGHDVSSHKILQSKAWMCVIS